MSGKWTATVPVFGPVAVSFRTVAEIAVAAALILFGAFRSCQLERAQKRAGALALEADTLRAAADTSKVIRLRLDSTQRAVQRQVVQLAQRADSIDRQLGLQRIAKTILVARIETLTVTARSLEPVVEDVDGERAAAFAVDSTPFHVRAEVFMPRPPEAATISLSVSVDSIPLEVRHGCTDDANAAGIRSAFVTVVGPAWAPLQLGRVEQDPGLCRSPALEPKDSRSRLRKLIDRAGVSAGIDVRGKPNALIGFKLWP